MNDAELVKSKIDIVEVIANYVELKKAGKDYRACSPFRDERTPSFFVSPEKQIWHDFGANEGGDIISFVMRAEGLSFPEALEMLAAKAGVTLSRQPQRSGPDKNRLYAAVDLAVKYYHRRLSQTPEALEYIKAARGLQAATIKAYTLGYAPDAWSDFTDYALSKGLQLSELVTAGLSAQKSGRQTGYDLFRGRIMFPVYDAQGRAVGFSGRVLTPETKTAKYINSPDTPIYHKNRAIFGLKQAKPSIRETNQVVVVEGHLDVISLWQHGQQNVVAVSGTALTEEQLTSLGRMADVVKLCFDQDSAGLKATQRAIELGSKLAIRLEVIRFSRAKDPDELVRSDPAAWQKAVESSEYAIDYLFRYASETYALGTGEGNKQFTKFLMPVLAQVSDRVEQEVYITRLASMVGVLGSDLTVIRDKITQERNKSVSTSRSQLNTKDTQVNAALNDIKSPEKISRQQQLEELLMEMLVAYPDTRIVLGDLHVPDMSQANQALVAALQNQPKVRLSGLLKVLPDQEERVKMLSLRGEHEYSHLSEHERGLEAFTQVHTVQKQIFSLKKKALSQELAIAEQNRDTAAAGKLLRQYQSLLEDESAYR